MSKIIWPKLVTGVIFFVLWIVIVTSMTFVDMMKINAFFPVFLLFSGILNSAFIADSFEHVRPRNER